MMCIQPLLPEDFLQILQETTDFWGSDRTLPFHHPMFVYEFGNAALVIKEGNLVVAYLLGFVSQTEPVGYVHLIGVRQNWQRKGLGTMLYQHFTAFAKAHGFTELKAITTPGNLRSIQFHQNLGMQMIGEERADGIRVVRGYSGPGQDRVVFRMKI
jgi:GNAT superfamily N-acetyltransferase